MWHVSSRSGVATLRTAIYLLLTYLLGFRTTTNSICWNISLTSLQLDVQLNVHTRPLLITAFQDHNRLDMLEYFSAESSALDLMHS